MATAIDIGNPADIHPHNKQEVGRRLALAARHVAYGDNQLTYSGPTYASMSSGRRGRALEIHGPRRGAGRERPGTTRLRRGGGRPSVSLGHGPRGG
ncbi:MAG: hypothetical protein WKG07_36610 [Hymenobacter sp.]